ncbi:hypothetical protein, partial [Streptomyces sp. NPDC046925]|uniref:hypothetical protein n=1 Tax=Streptomyces sp. NPDC046925 TaxID=3155375 RepID=UPI0033FEBD2E
SLAAEVPVFMATPTSAWASAGASLVPSPDGRGAPGRRLPLAHRERVSAPVGDRGAAGVAP